MTMTRLIALALWGILLATDIYALVEPDWRQVFNESYSNYYSSFQAPKPGNKITFYLRIGGKREGILQNITPTSITVMMDGQTRSFDMATIAPESVAMFSPQAFARVNAQRDTKQKQQEFQKTKLTVETAPTHTTHFKPLPIVVPSTISESAKEKPAMVPDASPPAPTPNPQQPITPARSQQHESSGCGTGIGWVIAIVIILFIVGATSKPRSCNICGQVLKRNSYRWKIGGNTQVLCPKCNSRMENKVSKEAFNKTFK